MLRRTMCIVRGITACLYIWFWLTNKPARVSNVSSFRCVKLKNEDMFSGSFKFTNERMHAGAKCDKESIISINLTNLLPSARASQVSWPVSFIYMRKFSPFRRDPGTRQTGSQQSGPDRHIYKHKLILTKL